MIPSPVVLVSPPGLRQFAIFALPALPLAVVVFPSHAVLPGFYAQHTQIPLVTIGIVLIAARIFDAVIDPAIGFASDATIGRWRSRKPWLLAGAVVFAVSVVPLYMPAADAGVAWLIGWFLAFYLGYSLIEIPFKAWGTELARNYADRSRIATCLAMAFALGNLAFAVAPFLSPSGARVYDADTLALVGWGAAIGLLLAVAAATRGVPDGALAPARRADVRSIMQALCRNQPLQRFVAMFMLTGLGQGIFYGLVFLYVGSVLQLATVFAWVLLTDALVTLASIPAWYVLVRRLQKHRAWALGLVVSAFALFAMLRLPADDSAIASLLVLVSLRAFGSAVTQVAPNALLGDVVDYELFKRGVNQAANFHALVSLLTKLTATIGAGGALLVVGLGGFDPQAINPPAVLAGFKGVALFVPGVVLVAGAAVAMGFGLDRRRHAVVLRWIERRIRHAS